MSKMIQVRNVSERMHRELTRRARLHGQSLTQYIEDILKRELSRPPRQEVFDRIESRKPVNLGRPAAEIIRQERRRRERHLANLTRATSR